MIQLSACHQSQNDCPALPVIAARHTSYITPRDTTIARGLAGAARAFQIR